VRSSRYLQPHVGINAGFRDTWPVQRTPCGRQIRAHGRGLGGLPGPASGPRARAGRGLNTLPHLPLRVHVCLQGYLALSACSRYFDGIGVLVLDWWELVGVCSFVREEMIGSAFWAIGGALEACRRADLGLIWSIDRKQNFREF